MPQPTVKLLPFTLLCLKLGCTSFGGPIAHLSYYRREFVTARHWLTDEQYADLVALCQFLPGPASSQTLFAIGYTLCGLPGALMASIAFTLPSAILMTLFGLLLVSSNDLTQNPQHTLWLHGLRLAVVPVVATVLLGMAKNLTPDRPRLLLALLAAVIVLLASTAYTQIVLIAAGTALACYFYRSPIQNPKTKIQNDPPPLPVENRKWKIENLLSLLLFTALLIALPLIAAAHPSPTLKLADRFYRTGALVFGGGHVVLPLLKTELIPTFPITPDQFMTSYGFAQAIPGPLFTLSAFLGTVATGPHPPLVHALLHAAVALIAIFLPGYLLVLATLPLWHSLKKRSWAAAGLKGANAVVVGLLLAAFYNPVLTEAVRLTTPSRTAADGITIIIAFICLNNYKMPPWLLVLLCAITAQFILPA